MSRRKRTKSRANRDRWLVSYADFITLLFAFFVVLYASSQVDKRKVGKLALAIQVAFQEMGVFQASTTRSADRCRRAHALQHRASHRKHGAHREPGPDRVSSRGRARHRRGHRKRRSGRVAGGTGNRARFGNQAQGNRHAPRARRSGDQFARGRIFRQRLRPDEVHLSGRLRPHRQHAPPARLSLAHRGPHR